MKRLCLILFLAHVMIIHGNSLRSLGICRISTYEYRYGLFNPDGRTVRALGWKKWPHGSFSQFLSMQGHWKATSWQIDIMGTAHLDSREDNEVRIHQLYFERDFLSSGILVFGRAIQRWGTGYAFNPTDVVAPSKEISDPENNEKRLVGNDILKIEFFGGSYSLAACALSRITFDDGLHFADPRLALRFYWNVGGVDLSWIAAFQKKHTPIWGWNFSFVLGDNWEFHGEFAVQKNSRRVYHPSIEEPFQLYTHDPMSRLKQTDNKNYSRILLGFQATFPGNVFLVSEFYHQDDGYKKDEWNRLMDYAAFLNEQVVTSYAEAAEGNLLWALQAFSSQGARQNYWMNRIDFPINLDFHLVLTSLFCVDDGSSVVIPEVNVRFENAFTFYARSTIFQGDGRSEYGALVQSRVIEGGLRIRL